MSDIIGTIGGIKVEKYAVLQVNDGEGKGWLDFSTLREPWEFETAVRMVDNRGGINGFRVADYRIWQRGKPVYTHDPNRFKFNGIVLETGDILQIHRLGDEDGIDAGWITCRVIRNIEDAKIAVERCGRFRDSESLRHYRVITDQGTVKLSQMTPNGYRLSGILWTCDPLRLPGVASDRYDQYAARIMECESEWDTQIVPILNELDASETLRDRVHSFLTLIV
jgi:hypothetical protein